MAPKGYRLFHVVAILTVACLMISNTIAVKLFTFGSFAFPAGIIVFPLAYILNDVLTEVYGYERTRGVIWIGFVCLALMVVCYFVSIHLQPFQYWNGQEAFESIFTQTPRIVVASFIAYLVGAFLNSIVMSYMKIKTKGKYLWTRTIGSTIVGEGADSLVFNVVAFVGIFPNSQLLVVVISGFIFKVLFEVIATPLTYWVIGRLKEYENTDVYDFDVDYTPFKI